MSTPPPSNSPSSPLVPNIDRLLPFRAVQVAFRYGLRPIQSRTRRQQRRSPDLIPGVVEVDGDAPSDTGHVAL